MTRQWYLSSDATKSIDVVSICADALFALEQCQAKTKNRTIEEKEVESSLERCKALISMLRDVAKNQITPGAAVDPLSFRLIDNLRRKTGSNATELSDKLSRVEGDLSHRHFSTEVVSLLKLIADEGSTIAEASLEGLNPIS